MANRQHTYGVRFPPSDPEKNEVQRQNDMISTFVLRGPVLRLAGPTWPTWQGNPCVSKLGNWRLGLVVAGACAEHKNGDKWMASLRARRQRDSDLALDGSSSANPTIGQGR